MPNWCNNDLILKHDDPKMIERFHQAFLERRTLQEFIPCPKPLVDTVAGQMAEGYERDLHEATQEINRRYFGHANWYDFCVNRWGTKWDIGGKDSFIKVEGNTITCSFESAWSPPEAAYLELIEMGFTVDAKYWEPGGCFVGTFTNDDDCCYTYSELKPDSLNDIPPDLVDFYDIRGYIAGFMEECAE